MARPKLGESDSKRLQMVITEDELAAIEEWQHGNMISSKSEAIRRLCQIALFVEQELEEVVDAIGEGVETLSAHGAKLNEVFRLIINRETDGVVFDRDQVWDILTLARDQADIAEEGFRGVHSSLVTMYNAIAVMAEARSVRGAAQKSNAIVKKFNADFERAEKRKAKREAQYEENKYLIMVFSSGAPEERANYELLSDRKKDQYLKRRISELREEELADPVAFAERHGIDNRKFWEKPEWQTFLEARASGRTSEVKPQ